MYFLIWVAINILCLCLLVRNDLRANVDILPLTILLCLFGLFIPCLGLSALFEMNKRREDAKRG